MLKLSSLRLLLPVVLCTVSALPGQAQTATTEPQSLPSLSTYPAEEPSAVEASTVQPAGQPLPGANVAAPQLPAYSSVAAPTSYFLGAGDRIALSVALVEEYSGEYQVLSDGTVNLALIGSVPVGGLTIQQATEAITSRYRRYMRNPVISVDLISERPIRIAITGEINRPGTYTVTETDEEGIPNVTEAIQLAGGITQLADVRNVQVYRQQPGLAGGSAAIDVDLWELLTAGDISQDISLRDGDTLLIPVASALDSREVTAIAEASFSPEEITVNVVGEVEVPGAVEVQPNTPLNQALLAAGGFNNRAATGNVELIRLNPNGTVLKQDIEVDFAENVDTEANPALRDNDTIVVSRSGATQAIDTVTPFLNPFTGIVRFLDLLF
ncbi:MAG: polysaccharide biosynthesis/export family protein [Cyanobacteria bacterium P01_A01_bin.116]